jgi:hypothetical protein
MLALRMVWGAHARRALDARLAGVRARGEPATPAEVDCGPRVLDAENAYYAYDRAAAAVKVASPRNSPTDPIHTLPFDGAWLSLAARSEAANAAAFTVARSARRLSRAHIRDSTSAPLPMAMLDPIRRLGNTLADGSVYAQHLGDDAEALERLADILDEARALRGDPELTTHMMAGALDSVASQTALIVAPGLRFGPGEDGVRTPASRAAVSALIVQLLDERPARAHLTASMRAERAVLVDNQLTLTGRGTWVTRPLVDLDAARLADAAALDIAAAGERTLPAALAVLAPRPPDLLYRDNMRPRISEPQAPRYSRWFHFEYGTRGAALSRHFGTLALRRVAAVSLAARLYRADHAGVWPDRLDQLVPAYLSAVPADPLAADDRPLGYVVRRRGPGDPAPRPMVYFEGGVDRPDLITPQPMYDWQVDPGLGWHPLLRQYRDLSRFAPPSTP